jgi:hypothetical protein
VRHWSGSAGLRRGAALGALLFQLVLVGVLPVVHALSEQENLRHTPHIEAQNDGSPCPASHEDAACTTCRGLHHAAAPTVAGRVTDAETIGHEHPVDSLTCFVRSVLQSGSLGSRAPPIA